ncbi:MAG: hypothetical protein ACREEC_03345 [Thermoplasmata archaeon]
MQPEERRPVHPCATNDCGHPDSDHIATPELAAPAEVVVWCARCHRHEVGRPRRLRLPWSRGDPPGRSHLASRTG